MERIRITYGDETVTMEWDGAQASAPIYVDGEVTPYQTANARHRTDLAVALVARYVWPEAAWPHVPSTGLIGEGWADDCAAWDDLAYTTCAAEVDDTDTVTASNARPSGCVDMDGAIDVDVEVTIGGRTISGEVTLVPSEYDGTLVSYGTSPDHWISGGLLASMRDLPDARFRTLCDALRSAADEAADEAADA